MDRPHPVTPDGRYFVVRGRLWRCSDPALPPARRQALVADLMRARSAVGRGLRQGDAAAERAARDAVDVAKRALGERGPPWWDDGAPDFNRRPVAATPYADWFAKLPGAPAGTPGTRTRPADRRPAATERAPRPRRPRPGVDGAGRGRPETL